MKYKQIKMSFLLLSVVSFSIAGQIKPQKLVSNRDSLAFELCQLYGSDQSLRNIGNDKSYISSKLDSINFSKIITFIGKYGFPSESLLGVENMKYECVEAAAIAILLHSPQKVVTPEIYALLKSEVIAGNLKPTTFSYFLDKYYVYYKKYSLFGSRFMSDTPCKGVRLKDKNIVNKARMDIGLEALPDSAFVNCTK